MAVQKKADAVEPSLKSTKQELLDAYAEMRQQLQERDKTQLKPEQKIQEKKEAQVLTAVQAMTADGVLQKIGQLKQEMTRTLADLGEKLASEVDKCNQVQQAIEIKEKELAEVFEIDKAAGTLAALIEAQHREQEQFERKMAEEKERLTGEIESIRDQWKNEKAEHDALVKEQDAIEAKRRQRQQEEYKYAFEREQQLARDKFEDEKAKMLAEKGQIDKEMKALKEQTEKGLQEREKQIAEREKEFASLQTEVQGFAKRLDAAVAAAVKETTERVGREAKYQQDLVQKDFEGQKNVLTARIQSLEKTVKEQAEQLVKLSQQQEAAYQKIQDVAVKAIEGASKLGSFGSLVHTLKEQTRKQANEE
ncbi:MAG TPA: hypothetical protein PKH24_06055 [Sedimentisphaerales bacterium]|jgi:hypothetical protein|nr:hypothetical protein [Sedimentisphaerales bacterium]HNU27802.1 hypothetical protein [Sedimentisphaerales bacterium]